MEKPRTQLITAVILVVAGDSSRTIVTYVSNHGLDFAFYPLALASFLNLLLA